MDTDDILQQMADLVGKRKGDLKRTFNALEKKKKDEGVADVTSEDIFLRLVLLGVCNKYGILKEQLDIILEGEVSEDEPEDELEEESEIDFDDLEDEDEEIGLEELEEELNDDEDDDLDEDEDENGFAEFDSFDEVDEMFEEGPQTWEEIFTSTPDPEDNKNSFEKIPNLLIMPNAEYYLKIKDTDELPYKHEGIGEYDNKPYTSRAIDVTLKKVSPQKHYREKYDSGDFRGQKCYINGNTYKLWLSESAWGWFVKFWIGLGLSAPDKRIFIYEKVKKPKVTNHYFTSYKKK